MSLEKGWQAALAGTLRYFYILSAAILGELTKFFRSYFGYVDGISAADLANCKTASASRVSYQRPQLCLPRLRTLDLLRRVTKLPRRPQVLLPMLLRLLRLCCCCFLIGAALAVVDTGAAALLLLMTCG